MARMSLIHLLILRLHQLHPDLLIMVIMLSLAIAATEVPLIGVAAILFAISDVSVARDRFVSRDIANKAWGLPLYYIAQLLFAASVITVV